MSPCCAVMDRDLIIKTLKSACGNKNFRFQVIVQKSKLHIYINRQVDYVPDYILLTDTITQAIASLALDSFEGMWLYSRELGEIKPDWQVFVESPRQIDEEEIPTFGSSQKNQLKDGEEMNFPEFEEFQSEENSSGDTGLLKETGLIHGKPLQEEKIATFAVGNVEQKINSSPKETETETDTDTDTEINPLAQYCFVANKKILTGDILPPAKEVIRLVKFFHHLSENNQQKILPIVDDFLTKNKIPDLEGKPSKEPDKELPPSAKLPITLKKWLKQIIELQEENRLNFTIWLSRYCFDSSTTLAEFQQMEERKAASATKRNRRVSNTEYDCNPANLDTPIKTKQSEDLTLTEKRWQFPPIVEKSLIPIVWTLATVILIFLGIYTNNANLRSTSEKLPQLCRTTIGSPNYCRLGVNLVGKNAIQQASESIFPLTEVTETVAKFGCERFANVKAGAFSNLDPQENPVVSSRGEKIFPHIYVVEAVQKDISQPTNIRVACVYTTGPGERSPTKLASDIIPLNWPTEHYQQEAKSESNLSFGIYTNLINLGLYTLFSAIGIAIAAEFKLGIYLTNRPQTVYLVALILGIVQLIAVNLPFLNFLASITFSILAIAFSSQLIKSFKLNFQNGYPLVAAGILTIVAVQFLLYGICWQLINSLV